MKKKIIFSLVVMLIVVCLSSGLFAQTVSMGYKSEEAAGIGVSFDFGGLWATVLGQDFFGLMYNWDIRAYGTIGHNFRYGLALAGGWTYDAFTVYFGNAGPFAEYSFKMDLFGVRDMFEITPVVCFHAGVWHAEDGSVTDTSYLIGGYPGIKFSLIILDAFRLTLGVKAPLNNIGGDIAYGVVTTITFEYKTKAYAEGDEDEEEQEEEEASDGPREEIQVETQTRYQNQE